MSIALRTTLAIATLAAALFVVTEESHAEGARVRVRGTSHIDAHVARADGKLILSGTLVDDAARPIAGEKLTLAVTAGDHALSFSGADGGVATECGGSAPTLERADRLALKSDGVGRFCVRLALPSTSYVARLDFDGAGSIDGSHADVAIDLSRKPLALAFDPEPRAIDLDEPLHPMEVVATIEENGTTAPGAGLLVMLQSESGAVVASGTTNGSGRVRLSLNPATIGPPGRGELRVVFSGSADTAAAAHSAPIERRTHVVLAAPDARAGKLAAGAPEDGVAVAIEAQAKLGAAADTWPTGSIEAHVGDTIVGAAPLEHGKARVVVTFATPSTSDVAIRFRYAPDAPWLLRGDDLSVVMPVRGPSPWRNAPLAVAGIAVIAWLALGRARRPQTRREKPKRERAVRAEPKLDIVRAADAPSGWCGYVTDAHDDFGVEAARVSIERAGFERVEVIATATTNERGWFELPHVDTQPGDVLSAEGALHAAFRQALPPDGELAIALVQRKRALLDRLVAWARSRGRPFDAIPEPTPGHVRRTAAGEFTIARWADAVERAAYSGTIVDARAEAEVEKLAPAASAADRDPSRAAATVKDIPHDEPGDSPDAHAAQGTDPGS